MSPVVEDYRQKAERLSRLCALLEALPDPSRQQALIACLNTAGFLSDATARLLAEYYAGENV